MVCNYCHKEIPETAKFCAYCSTAVGDSKPQVPDHVPDASPSTTHAAPEVISAKAENTPWIAIVGFILSIFIGPLGLAISIYAYVQISRGKQRRGKGWAIAGLIIGSLSLVYRYGSLLVPILF